MKSSEGSLRVWTCRVQRFSPSMPPSSVWQAYVNGKFLAAWPLMLTSIFYYGHHEVTVSFIWLLVLYGSTDTPWGQHMPPVATLYTCKGIIHYFETRRSIILTQYPETRFSNQKCSRSTTHVLPCAMYHHVLHIWPSVHHNPDGRCILSTCGAPDAILGLSWT